MAEYIVECQEEVIKAKRRKKICNSKFLKHLFECLRDRKHLHMLNFYNEEQTHFIVTFTDKKSPQWKEQDISLFKEQDAIFPKRREKAKYELTCKGRFKANMKKLCDNGILKEVKIIKMSSCKYEKIYEILKFPIGDYKKTGSNNRRNDLLNDIGMECCDPDSLENIQLTNNIEVSHSSCLSGTPVYGENQAEASEDKSDNVISDLQNREALIQPDTTVNENLAHISSEHLYATQPYDISILEKMDVPSQPDNLYICIQQYILSLLEKKESPPQPDTEGNENVAHISNEPLYVAQPDNLSVLEKMKALTQPDVNLHKSVSDNQYKDNLTKFTDAEISYGGFQLDDYLPINDNVEVDYTNNLTQYSQDDAKLFQNNSSDEQMKDLNELQVFNNFNGCNGKLFENNPDIEKVSGASKDLQEFCADNLEFQNFDKNMKSLENPLLSSAVEDEDMLEAHPNNHLEYSSLEEKWMFEYSDVSKFEDV